MGKEEVDVDFPGSNPPEGRATVNGCSVESWTINVVSGFVPAFLMVTEKATFPFVSLARFAD